MNQNRLMLFVMIALIGVAFFPLTKKIYEKMKKYIDSNSYQQKAYLKDTLQFAITNQEMKKRFLITLFAMIIVQALDLIVLPGVDMTPILDFFNRQTASGRIAKSGIFTNLFERSRFGIFSVGLTPFISSCLFLQIASFLVPKAKKIFYEETLGRRKLVKGTYVLTIILCIVQSYGLAFWLEKMQYGGVLVVATPGLLFRIMTVLSLTAGTVVLLFIAQAITRFGLGNGVAIIVISSSLFQYIATGINGVIAVKNGTMSLFAFIVSVAVIIGLAYIFYYVTNIAQKIAMRKQEYEAAIPIRTTLVGNIPIGWGLFFVGIPGTVLAFFPNIGKGLISFFSGYSYNIIVGIVLIMLVTFVYAMVVFDSKRVFDMIQKYGFSLDNKPEEKSIDDLDDNVSKVLFITGFFLLGMYLVSNLKRVFPNVPNFDIILLLLIVGVFFDLIEQVKFYIDKLTSDIKNWQQCEISGDEIEAEIKSHYLKSQGIPTLIEPLRFSWGMPIRTIVDEYRIYVPGDKLAEAKNYLKG